MARTLVVGDVHGCLHELERLFERVALGSGDRVVMVGDLVAKGPDSLGVLRCLEKIGAESVLGNHDAHLLRCHHAVLRGEDLSHFTDPMRKLERKLGDDDWAWLEALPHVIELPAHHAIVVHAGLVPGIPIHDQSSEDLLTMRSIRPDGTASKRIGDGVPWASLWPGPLHIYFGHDAVRGLQRYPFATGLDTGCVYGGRLTGCLLPAHSVDEPTLVSVKAKRAYAEAGKALSARQEKRPK
jgi:hypothetical protein